MWIVKYIWYIYYYNVLYVLKDRFYMIMFGWIVKYVLIDYWLIIMF